MTKTNQNFTMRSGDTRTLNLTVYEADGVTPKDITGATIKWQAAIYSESDDFEPWTGGAVITKETGGSGITITDGANGQCAVAIDPADTASLKGIYFHELEVTLGGAVTTALSGIMTVFADLIA